LIRRNLQRDYLRRLSKIVIGQRRNPFYDMYSYISFFGSRHRYPADARSLARMHLGELDQKLQAVLESKDLKIDDATRAHLQEAQEQTDMVLHAKLTANGP